MAHKIWRRKNIKRKGTLVILIQIKIIDGINCINQVKIKIKDFKISDKNIIKKCNKSLKKSLKNVHSNQK